MNTLANPAIEAYVEVTLNQLKPYIFNYKSQEYRNPNFDILLQSIEDQGLVTPFTISLCNPTDSHYVITSRGETRLEILNILFRKYTMLANEAKLNGQVKTSLRHEEKAQKFNTLICIFKPWDSGSSILAARMKENKLRGKTLFQKDQVIKEFRRLYEEEDRAAAEAGGKIYRDKPLTVRALAERITAQGWKVTPAQITRFEKAFGNEKEMKFLNRQEGSSN